MEDAKTILKLCISNTFIKQLSNVCRISEITIPLREKKINIQFNKIVKELDYIKRYGNEKIILQKTILKNINDCFIENTYDYNNGVIEIFNDYNESIFYQYAVNEEQLKEFINLCINENINYYAIDIEGDLSVLQIFYTYNKIYKVIIIDMIKIELSYIKDILINILKSEKYKFFYDCRNDFNILEKKLNISYEIFNNCIDLQKDNISMKEILEKSNINHYLKKDIKNIMNESNQRNVDIWLHRPIHRDLLIYSMLDAYCTYKIYEKNKLIDYKNLSHLVEFTRNKYEHYKYGKIIKDTNIIIDSDINSIINLLDIDEDLEDIREMIKISTDIFIDSNRYLSFNKHGKLTINKNIYITKNKIKNIIEKCDWEESEDNRYIFGKTLHRLSKVFYNNDFFGLTLRIGRTISGLDALLPNYLFEKNILICGPPNVGKTSLLRTLCKYFSEINSLCLIDSSNEVVGCPFTNNIIGNTRTFSPQKIEDQYKLLIDIVKNHSPKYVVIDEIHTKKEINICSTIMKRGINMIAAVHGNFNELIYNNDLNEVLGGIQSTISGNQDRKMRTERDKKSSFDIIIQINYNEKENRYEYIFIDNIDDNIDEILNKKYVKSNMRYIKNNKVYEIETFLN